MKAKLYSLHISHPGTAVRRMLELKGIEHEVVDIWPGLQRASLRMHGFRGGTVPALRLEGRRIQGSTAISRALEELVPDPPLFPADPGLRRRVEEVEEWGEKELQEIPRRAIRWGLVRRVSLRRWLAEDADVPGPRLAAATGGPTARYYARASHASDERVREDLRRLPELLDEADALLAEDVIGPERQNAATFQVLSTVRLLDEMEDLRGVVHGRPVAAAARTVFPEFPGPVPAFLPPDWLPHRV